MWRTTVWLTFLVNYETSLILDKNRIYHDENGKLFDKYFNKND